MKQMAVNRSSCQFLL